VGQLVATVGCRRLGTAVNVIAMIALGDAEERFRERDSGGVLRAKLGG